MIISMRAFAAALAFSGIAATPALAQYGSGAPSQPATSPSTQPAAEPTRKFDISKGARKAILELQTAVSAKDVATIPAKLAAAQTAAKTNDDKYIVATLQLKAAANANNFDEALAAVTAMQASGAAQPREIAGPMFAIGKSYYGAKQFDKASSTLERVIALEPANAEALVVLGESRNSLGRFPEAVAAFEKGIAVQAASGKPVPESWHKRAVAIAFNNKLPQAAGLAMNWVKAYPTPTNWRDTLRIYKRSAAIDSTSELDYWRLARAAGALAGESDYYGYASAAAARGLPGEAKAVLEEGFAAKSIDRSKPIFRDVLSSASAKVAADRASLSALETTALSATAAKQAMVTGDAYLGYGEYAKAATLYRAALGKTGVDANVANMRLGIALARSGDRPGATAAFNAVGGSGAAIAKYWLLWLSTRP